MAIWQPKLVFSGGINQQFLKVQCQLNFLGTDTPRARLFIGMERIATASPYALHDQRPKLKNLTVLERRGERLFQANCAFCHAADGTGKNWIGSFLEPHPRNLRDPVFMSSFSREQFVSAVKDGLPNTSMPAWKNVLSQKDIDAIAEYVNRAFHPFASPQAAGGR